MLNNLVDPGSSDIGPGGAGPSGAGVVRDVAVVFDAFAVEVWSPVFVLPVEDDDASRKDEDELDKNENGDDNDEGASV